MIGFIFSCFFSSNLNTQGSFTETSSPALLSYVFCCRIHNSNRHCEGKYLVWNHWRALFMSCPHIHGQQPKELKKILQICIIFGWRISMYNQIKETYDHQVVLACSFPLWIHSSQLIIVLYFDHLTYVSTYEVELNYFGANAWFFQIWAPEAWFYVCRGLGWGM